jgi:hypothetical protein
MFFHSVIATILKRLPGIDGIFGWMNSRTAAIDWNKLQKELAGERILTHLIMLTKLQKAATANALSVPSGIRAVHGLAPAGSPRGGSKSAGCRR